MAIHRWVWNRWIRVVSGLQDPLNTVSQESNVFSELKINLTLYIHVVFTPISKLKPKENPRWQNVARVLQLYYDSVVQWNVGHIQKICVIHGEGTNSPRRICYFYFIFLSILLLYFFLAELLNSIFFLLLLLLLLFWFHVDRTRVCKLWSNIYSPVASRWNRSLSL